MPFRKDWNPAQAAAGFQAFAHAVETGVREALAEVAQDALQEAVRRSSGTATPATLRALGHPYARRRGRPGLPLDTINARSGVFREAWRVGAVQAQGGGVGIELVNTDPKAEWLLRGTATMFARPVDEQIEAVLRPELERALEQALREAFTR